MSSPQQPHQWQPPQPEQQHFAPVYQPPMPPRQLVPVVVRPAQTMGGGESLMWFISLFLTCGLSAPFWALRARQLRKAKIEYR